MPCFCSGACKGKPKDCPAARTRDAAEKVRKLSEGETLVEQLERVMRENPIDVRPYSTPPGIRYDCNCPTYGICMNTACPRATRITNCLNGTLA